MTTNIYILKLENNKYYVGKTDNLEKRKQAHLNGTASSWTKKYKPLSVDKIIQNASPFDEDKYTIEYMSIIPLLTKSIQELTARINDQQKTIDDLNDKLCNMQSI